MYGFNTILKTERKVYTMWLGYTVGIVNDRTVT